MMLVVGNGNGIEIETGMRVTLEENFGQLMVELCLRCGAVDGLFKLVMPAVVVLFG
jgi:hypothetical protein